jgi:hypothetical protein
MQEVQTMRFDPDRVQAHRLEQAAAGFPLLRGCPCTATTAALRWLDGLDPADRIAFATQLDALDRSPEPHSGAGSEVALAPLPLVRAFIAERPAAAQGVGCMPVKLFAALGREPGGYAAFADSRQVPAEARVPPPGLAASLDELVPVAPRRLRKLLDAAMAARYGADPVRISSELTRYAAAIPGGQMLVDITFPTGPRLGYQLHHAFSATMADGRRVWQQPYESVWRLVSGWDYLTEANAERSIAHLLRLTDASIALV